MRRPADRAESGLHRKSFDCLRFRRAFSSDEYFDDLRIGKKLQKIAELRVYHQFMLFEHLFRPICE
jgi:hypothetical protein